MTLSEQAASNPSVTGAAGGGSAGVAVVWFAVHVWPRVPISAEAGAGISTAAATVLGYMARHGVSGIWRTIRYGSAHDRPASAS